MYIPVPNIPVIYIPVSNRDETFYCILVYGFYYLLFCREIFPWWLLCSIKWLIFNKARYWKSKNCFINKDLINYWRVIKRCEKNLVPELYIEFSYWVIASLVTFVVISGLKLRTVRVPKIKEITMLVGRMSHDYDPSWA